jgi:hypothetical protein
LPRANDLSSPVAKNYLLPFEAKSPAYSVHPVPHEGRIAIVTDVGHGMRWTRQRRRAFWRGRTAQLADGEVVWFRRPDAGVKLRGAFRVATVTTKPVTEESTKETVKTIAQGRPGVPVNLWSTTVCFLPLHTGLWVQRAPGFPCALCF